MVIVDDVIDSATTITTLAKEFHAKGAKSVYVIASHALFCGDALTKIEESPIDKVFVTNSLPLPVSSQSSSKINQVSIAPSLARIIWTEHFRANSSDEEYEVAWEEES
jgi:ribose-phosphate pyrophosphokinase